MERLTERQIFSAVERNKAASKVVKRLFPSWTGTPTHGDLQRIVIALGEGPYLDSQAKAAGDWWLWIKDIAIDNTFTKKQQLVVLDIATKAASGKQAIHLVSARSPELLHAQVSGQGDPSLPRSRKAVEALSRLVHQSSQFLPTTLTILFADLAIDNLDAIKAACNVESIIGENVRKLEEVCQEAGLKDFRILRLSQIAHPQGELEQLISPSGAPLVPVELTGKSLSLIETVTRESAESHKRMFGWTYEQSVEHNRKLAITMGFVGQAVQNLSPAPILIHSEAFISRGALNNLFTDPNHPLPVIVLQTLLETKRAKT